MNKEKLLDDFIKWANRYFEMYDDYTEIDGFLMGNVEEENADEAADIITNTGFAVITYTDYKKLQELKKKEGDDINE